MIFRIAYLPLIFCFKKFGALDPLTAQKTDFRAKNRLAHTFSDRLIFWSLINSNFLKISEGGKCCYNLRSCVWTRVVYHPPYLATNNCLRIEAKISPNQKSSVQMYVCQAKVSSNNSESDASQEPNECYSCSRLVRVSEVNQPPGHASGRLDPLSTALVTSAKLCCVDFDLN